MTYRRVSLVRELQKLERQAEALRPAAEALGHAAGLSAIVNEIRVQTALVREELEQPSVLRSSFK